MPAFNADEILTQIQLGQIDPNWRVIYPQRSRFVRSPISYLIIIILSIIALYSMSHDNTVFVPAYSSDPLSQADFQLWRIVDYMFIGVLFVTAIISLLRTLPRTHANASQKPILILTPEGFILHQGRKTHAINYAEVVAIKMSSNFSLPILSIQTLTSGQKSLKIAIDGRFSHARQIAAGIINTQHSYTTSTIQQPQRS